MPDIQKLSDYGYNFQLKLIISLITDLSFLQEIIDILEPSFFESDANSAIVKMISDYFLEYKNVPTMEVLVVKIKEIENDILRETVKENVKLAYQHLKDEDLKFIKSKSLDFCKNQTLKKAIYESVDLLEQGDYEGIKTKIDTALKSGTNKDIGLKYKETVKERYKEVARHTIKTGWNVIDSLMDGGLGKGELGIIAGGPSVGKSWFLASIGTSALKQGLKVIHYTLELNQEYIGRRYDAILTGIDIQNLKYYLNDIEEQVKKLKEELIIKYYPSRTASLITLRSHTERSIMLGHKPDLIIVDYPDLLKYSTTIRNLREDQILGNIYVELRGFGGEYGVPVWGASQVHRAGAQDDVVEGNRIAASYEKLMHSDFLMSLSRKLEDKIAGQARGHVIKNRFGPEGVTLPSKFNASNGNIEIFEPQTLEGKQIRKEMDNNSEVLRKYVGSRYKELFKEESENRKE